MSHGAIPPAKPKITSYRDLNVYQLAHSLAVQVHALTMNLPKHEMYEEGAQVRRSSKSIPANLVEGFGRRRYKNEYLRFLVFAHASCDETIEHLRLLKETASSPAAQVDPLIGAYEELSRKLNRFIAAVERSHISQPSNLHLVSCILHLASCILHLR